MNKDFSKGEAFGRESVRCQAYIPRGSVHIIELVEGFIEAIVAS